MLHLHLEADGSPQPSLDLSPQVIMEVVIIMMEPFRELLMTMRDDGRLSEGELSALRVNVQDRTTRLPDLLRTRVPEFFSS
jgi:hypothetical protein